MSDQNLKLVVELSSFVVDLCQPKHSRDTDQAHKM